MTFKKNKFVIIKKALNKDICEVAFNYLILKRKVAEYFFKTKFIFKKSHSLQVGFNFSGVARSRTEVLYYSIKFQRTNYCGQGRTRTDDFLLAKEAL